MNYFTKHVHVRRYTRAFSMVELLVSVAIFTALTSIIMVSQGSLNNRINIDTLAHQIGQWVRDVQVSSMSVRKSTLGTFTSGYGLHFDISQPSQFLYFADINADGVYTAGVDALEKSIDLLQGYQLSALCGSHTGTAASSCASAVGFAATNVMDISFRRPNPDANIKGDMVGTPSANAYSPARIIITSPKGFTRTIEVWVTGQVSIQ